MDIRTYQDLVNRLLDTFGELSRDGRNVRLARRSVQEAYYELAKSHDWCYYRRQTTIATQPQQITGTVEYVHTGHEKGERVLLLTGATFPTDAYLWRIIIANVSYEVLAYIDETTIQLKKDTNPGADVAAGTEYTICKAVYELPSNFRSLVDCIDMPRSRPMDVISQQELLSILTGWKRPSDPIAICVRGGGEYYGSMSLEFVPPPIRARSYSVTYIVRPRLLNIECEQTGSVTVEGGSTVVTGTGTSFASKHVGAIIRFSESTDTAPSPPEGNIDADNPYVAQRTVLSVTSDSELIIDAPVSNDTDYTGVKYVISDPIDIEPTAMTEALERAAEADFARRSARGDETIWTKRARESLLVAMAADKRLGTRTRDPSMLHWGLSDWAIAEDFGGRRV